MDQCVTRSTEVSNYVEQSVSGLYFGLSSVSLEEIVAQKLTKLSEIKKQFGLFEITATIIGESHVLSCRIGDSFISEVVACVVLELPGQIYFGDLASLRGTFSKKLPSAYYFFNSQVETHGKKNDELEEFLEEIKKNDPNNIGLLMRFEKGPNDLFEPITAVHVGQIDDLTLEARTAHCYPHEDKIVFTTTQITVINHGG